MATSLVARSPASGRDGRRKQVETVLNALGLPVPERRSPPPEGRLGADEDYGRRLREALTDLGPVFAGFGRYLGSRADLAPRRTRAELATIPDEGQALPFASVAALVRAQLGARPERLFFEFHRDPVAVGSWTQSHLAWLAPGVPALVTIVRPDAADELDIDIPLLPLLAPWIDVPAGLLAAAVADYELTVRRRLDQKHQAASLTSLAADARSGGGFDAPACYRDHCAPNVLTVERLVGEPLDAQPRGAEALARRVTAAWLRQAFAGNVVPYDFGPRDLVVIDERLVLTGGALEPHSSVERARFAAYLSAVASDDPDAAANWIVEGASPSPAVESRLRRLLRQAVPFREGEWSGDDRLVQHVLVQWRVARNAGWPVSPHHLHLYRGLQAVAQIAHDLAPDVDTLLRALEDERLRIGLSQAGELLSPRYAVATLDRAIQELADLPQKFDDVLTMASQGRLRMNLQVPEAEENERVRNRTVLLVTTLVAFAAVATIARHLAPAFGVGIERAGAIILLLVGGWLLFAASRL
ncbi:MAG TPA: AarF/UbiB family protein [Vicinamibacterales bacterium]|nr:AarF/UbiB family protein [Vicinamibacterales bacterium]